MKRYVYFIGPPQFSDDFGFGDMIHGSFPAKNPEQAWRNFCHPALNRSAYESEGWKPYKVAITWDG